MAAIDPSCLPTDIWTPNTLRLPECVSATYQLELAARSLELPLEAGPQDIIGGQGKEASEQHFRYRFCVSAGRGCYACLDPLERLEDVSSHLQSSLGDGSVGILDLACGAGAASGGILGGIAALRRTGILPQLPLNVQVLGADFSPTCLDLFQAVMTSLRSRVGGLGIAIDFETCNWDVTDLRCSSDLCDKWLRQDPFPEELIIILANFSGALRDRANRSAIEEALKHILTRVHSCPHTLLWFEPQMKGVVSTHVPWFRRFVSLFPWLRGGDLAQPAKSADYGLDDRCRPPYPSSIVVERVIRAY